MKRDLTLLLAVLCAASPAAAQGTKAPAKPDSAKAPAQSGIKAPAQTVTKAPPPATKGPVPQVTQGTKADTKPATKSVPTAGTTTKAPAPPAAGTKVAQAPQAVAKTPTIMREVFGYAQEGRRDPFATLLTSSDLRPTVADLKLTGILYDENGSNSIAIMRDLTDNKQYRVTTGQTLGRMKVALIKRKAVIFSIEAFGMNRQDSLVLGDTTKVRVVK